MNFLSDSLDWLDPDALLKIAVAVAPRVLAAVLVLLAFYILLRVLQPALRNILQRARNCRRTHSSAG